MIMVYFFLFKKDKEKKKERFYYWEEIERIEKIYKIMIVGLNYFKSRKECD